MKVLRFAIMISIAILLIVLIPTFQGLAQANSFTLGRFLLGGGGASSGESFSLSGSMLQAYSNLPLSGGNFDISGNLQQPADYQVVYVNSAWEVNQPGTDLGANLRFLSNAFADLQLGHDHVAQNGLLKVYSGTYNAFHLDRLITVDIQANASINGNLQLSAGLLNAPSGNLQLTGGFIQDGGNFVSRNGKIRFSGSGEKNFTLTSRTQFSELIIDSDVTLIETFPANNALINGSLMSQGTIRKTLPISGGGVYSFGLTGATISFAQAGTLTQLQIDKISQVHSKMAYLPGGRRALPIYYKITPINGTGEAQICLSYTVVELALISPSREESFQLCEWEGSAWNCHPRSQHSDLVNRTVCADRASTSSDWIIATNEINIKNLYYLPNVNR